MIYVAQGYEKSSALALFLRALSCYPQYILENFCLVIDQRSIIENNLYISHDQKHLIYNSLLIPIIVSSNDKISITQSSLETCLSIIDKGDALFTLPTQKNQLVLNNKFVSGYTEFFRNYFSLASISMCFKSPNSQMLLISDHIPLRDVPKLKLKQIKDKLLIVIESNFFKYKNCYILGINPHAGENGLIGKEDKVLSHLIDELRVMYREINFIGPIAGDSSLISISNLEDALIVSPYHDQGLSLFKSLNGLIGANISIGMPFVRYSVDHGTAPNKSHKDLSISGMIYCINLMLKNLGQ